MERIMKPNVAFICVHNSCRSQMAEALAKKFASESFNAYSAGSELKKSINEDAVQCIIERIGIDMTISQEPKLLDALPEIDIVITMGCYDVCPSIPCRHREDWGLEDPTGKGKEFFELTIDKIIDNIENLKARIDANEL